MWWEQLLRGAGKLKLAYVGGREYNLETLERYVVQQAGASVATYIELYGVERLVAKAKARPQSQAQLDLLEQARAELLAGAQHVDFI